MSRYEEIRSFCHYCRFIIIDWMRMHVSMSAYSLFVVGIILVGVLVLYLYVTNYKDNHYGGRFHKDF